MGLVGTNLQNGYNNSDWDVLIDSHQDATSNYTRVAYDKIDTHIGRTYYLDKPGNYGVSDAYHTSLLLPTSIPSNADVISCKDIALAKLKKKLAEDTPRETGLTFLAELGKTRKLVAQVAQSTTNILSYLIMLNRGFRKPYRHRNVYRLNDGLDRIIPRDRIRWRDTPYGYHNRDVLALASDAWLNWSFGVKPLMYDVENSANALAAYLLRENYHQRYYGHHTVYWHAAQRINRTYSSGGAPGVSWYSDRNEQHMEYRCEYNAGVSVPMRSGNSYTLNKAFGFTFGDIVPTLWEITPYSWVFDYFTTVGEFLEDTFVGDAGYPYYVCFSEKFTCQSIISWYNVMTSLNWGDSIGQTSGQVVIFKRTKLAPTIPRRALRFKTYDEIGKNAVNKVLNLASVLLTQGKLRTKLRI